MTTTNTDNVTGPPNPTPSPETFEISALRELLLYPRLRRRWISLAEHASPPMRQVLDDLATSGDDIATVLARHLDPDTAARLAAFVPTPGGRGPVPSTDAGERTLEAVARFIETRQRNKAAYDAAIRELTEAEASGGDTEEILRRLQGLARPPEGEQTTTPGVVIDICAGWRRGRGRR